ncbi:CDP-diacylglycerol--glycerol-3-phosphate 3-phosphatidyltransferase [Novispirillum sp. DQ9]|uniref:CDP-diacylglycerol--glycerol-3-phosphate 3-phosphatidyltransferase n=1 Tax=Novispirillum sp. DQ9 TaxID=3398612 RepID=UPI003C7C6314
MFNLPNLLTLSRIIVIPLVVATFYIDGPTARWVAVTLFAAAAISDFFDGWLARRWNQVSSLGRFLDPIADKLLVAAVLLMLVAFGRVGEWSVLPAVVILCREILVSGLREFLAELHVGVPVTKLAKWKTTFQLMALPILLIGDAAPFGIPGQLIGEVSLWVAAVLTVVTGWDYLRAGLAHMRAHPAPPPPMPAVGQPQVKVPHETAADGRP